MKFSEQPQVVSDLRALADFYERPESIVLPAPNLYETFYVSHYEWIGGKYQVNTEKSKRKLKRIVKALGQCEKDWGSDDLQVIKRIGSKIKLAFRVDREAICEKVLTGNKIIHPATVSSIPERIEDQFEWKCDDVSLLS